jgi:hypothetical protein
MYPRWGSAHQSETQSEGMGLGEKDTPIEDVCEAQLELLEIREEDRAPKLQRR